MDEKKLLRNDINVKQLAYGMMAYTAGSISGPLILFGGIGYFLDKFLNTKPFLLIAGVLVAFVVSNVLIIKKVNKLSKRLDSINPEKEKEEENTPSPSTNRRS